MIAHSAFFFSGSVLRFSLNKGADAADPFLSGKDGAWFGFCTMMVPSSGKDERMLKPAKVSSEGRD